MAWRCHHDILLPRNRYTGSEATEIVALEIYQRCDKSGERITLGTVERRLAELAGHPPGHCPLCKAAAQVTVQRVYWIAACWQAQIEVTRRRAMR